METIKRVFNNLKNRKAILLFSIAYLVIAILVLTYLLHNNLTFVRNGDSYTQHYPAFLYMGKWYRDSVKGLFTGKRLPQMWDFSIGYGLDVSQTLSFYGFYDITTILFSLFTNESNGCWVYTIMMLFQTYLCGIAFVLFCEKHKCSEVGTTISAIAYILCPYMLENVFNGHPTFSIPLMYLPLILLGIEKIMDDENCLPYIFVIFLAIMSSQYYFYMEMIFAVIYFLCRCFSKYKDNLIKKGYKYGILISIYTISGIFMSLPFILPIVAGLAGDERTNTSIIIPLLYPMEQYRNVIGNFLTSDSFNYYSYIGISSCIMLGVVSFFVSSKDIWLKVLWIISLISCLIPYTGYFMNGMSYIANRHVWTFSFVTCFIFAKQFDYLLKSSKQSIIISGVVITLYSVLLIAIGDFSKKEQHIGIIIIFVGLVIVAIGVFASLKEKYRIISSIILFGLVILGVFVHIHSIYIERGAVSLFFSQEHMNNILDAQYQEAYKSFEADTSPWRMDWYIADRHANTLCNASGEGSTYTYWSFINTNLTSYLAMNGILNYSFETETLYNREYLQALNDVKYVSDVNGVHYNENHMPLGRLYDECISENDYKLMSYAEKEKSQALYCVVENENIRDAQRFTKTSVTSNNIDYEFVTYDNSFDGKNIIINNINEPIVLNFDCPEKGTLYLEIYNINGGGSDESSDLVIKAECNGIENTKTHLSPSNIYYWGKKDYLFNMEYCDERRETINLWFSAPGEYTIDDLKLEYVSHNEFLDTIDSVKRFGIDDTIIDGDAIISNIDLTEDKIIYYSIPYSNGWKMYVDGEQIPIFRTNIMGIGAEIESGSHEIVLKYRSPYCMFGLLFAMFGVSIFLMLFIYQKKRKVDN